MTEVVGIIEQISSRDTDFGKMYSYKVNGSFYGAGKYPVRDVKEGDLVKVKYTTNPKGYHNIDKGGMIKQDLQSLPRDAAQLGLVASPVYVDKKQITISKQSAYNTAIALVALQIQVGGIKFPANAKAPDVFTSFNNIVVTEAQRIYKLNTGEEWVIADVEKPLAKASVAAVADDDGYSDYPDSVN